MANNKFYNALNQISQSTPPIWFMRQAGRYHSHYQQLKLKYTFEELCKNSELAAEVACGPVEEFDFDVAILFSDILFPLEGLGMPLQFNPGPVFGEFLNQDNINKFLQKSKKKFENLFKIKIEYLENRSVKTLALSNKFLGSKIFLSYYFKDIRLIDNF